MAESKETFQDPGTLAKALALLGYFSTGKDVPTLLRTLRLTWLIPQCAKDFLLRWNDSSDFWISWAFLLLYIAVISRAIYKPISTRESPSGEDQSAGDRLAKLYRRDRLIKALRTLGFSYIRNFLLDRLNVASYGTFKRGSDWAPAPDRFDSIDRFHMIDGSSTEFQFPKNFKNLIVRRQEPSTSEYGAEVYRSPIWCEFWLLMVGSNIFPLWVIVNFFLRAFWWIKKKL